MNLDALRRRAEIVRGIRGFFDGHGFVEVETPVRIAAPAPEEHIDCPPVVGGGFLRASPELQMKKLLAEGMDRIYQIGPCFREGENGSRHNPEFTMIEWYRQGATYLDIKADLEALLLALRPVPANQTIRQSRYLQNPSKASRGATGTPWNAASSRGVSRSARHGLEVLQVPQSNNQTILIRDAYREWAGWDPWAAFDQDRFDFDMATKVEPAIRALGGGVFLMDYPPQAASLAKLRGDVAERWEFYWDGMELANCFTELCDAAEQTRRFERARAARRELGESDYPIDGEFLETLPKIGSAAGVALGVDRLVMVLAGLRDIHQVRVGM